MSYLNQILALGFGDQRLKLGCGEGIDKTRFGNNQEQDLCSGKDGELISLACCQLMN